MKCTKSQFGLLAVLFMAACVITGCSQGPVDVTTEIEEANKVFMETQKSGDPEALSMLYTSDAILLPANSTPVDGREAIKEYWSKSMAQGVSTELVVKTVSAQGFGNMAIEEGRYKVNVGDQEVDKGKYIVTWKKEAGQWKLHQDIWNSDLALPEARAEANETVWVIRNRIKADKAALFEEFNFSYLEPALAENFPHLRNTIRVLRPAGPNQDGTYTYFYLLDPAASIDGYGMANFLSTKYGKEKSDEYLKIFADCLVDGQEMFETVQTLW